jgi:hypothetical protein
LKEICLESAKKVYKQKEAISVNDIMCSKGMGHFTLMDMAAVPGRIHIEKGNL